MESTLAGVGSGSRAAPAPHLRDRLAMHNGRLYELIDRVRALRNRALVTPPQPHPDPGSLRVSADGPPDSLEGLVNMQATALDQLAELITELDNRLA